MMLHGSTQFITVTDSFIITNIKADMFMDLGAKIHSLLIGAGDSRPTYSPF